MLFDHLISKVTRRLTKAAGVFIMLAVALSFIAPVKAHAQDRASGAPTLSAADPTLQGDGTMGPAAAAAFAHGPLPFSSADVEAKAAANRAHDAAVRSGALRPAAPAELAVAGGAAASAKEAAVVGGLNFPGQISNTSSPIDSMGAIGTTRYIQIINNFVQIYNRATGAPVGKAGRLNDLANNSSSVLSYDPQMMWDPNTNRFYYAMNSNFSATDNKLAIGWSKTATPHNFTTDWCHYYINYGTPFPSYPKLGNSAAFIIIGVNVFAHPQPGSAFNGSNLMAFRKPPAGTNCPAFSTLKFGTSLELKDSNNLRVYSPVPAVQVDPLATGYAVARHGGLPATKLWFFNVTSGGNGFPVFGKGRSVTVASYAIPADATQPGFTQKLETWNARTPQAIQAFNPARGKFSFWTQHTVASGNFSAARWYEIDPVPATPVVLSSGNIAAANTFIFNGAISPDRKKNGATTAFGNSFVIAYNASSGVNGIRPRIEAASSVNGAAVGGSSIIKNGVGPFRDYSCRNPGDTCRWGETAAMPDPAPTTATRGMVWGTNQFSGVVNPSSADGNGRTQIFALQP